MDLASRKPAWTFRTEGSRKNLAALSKPDGSPSFAVAFTSNYYVDMVRILLWQSRGFAVAGPSKGPFRNR